MNSPETDTAPAGGERTARRVGRPWKINPQRVKAIIDAIAGGNYGYVAAEWAGVGTSTYHEWLQKGADIIARAQADGLFDDDRFDTWLAGRPDLAGNPDTGTPEAPYYVALRHYLEHSGYDPVECLLAELAEGVTRAERQAEVRLVANWSAQAAQDWRAARDLLARRHPDRWKEHTATEVSGGMHVDTDVHLVDVARAVQENPEALDAALRALEAVAPMFGAAQAAVDLVPDDLDDDDVDVEAGEG